MGHGIGGRIGMYTALTRPELVNRLVVISSSPLNNTARELERMDVLRQACYIIQTLALSNNIVSQEMLASMEFKLEAELALKPVIKEDKARALFISNLGQVNHPAILANPDLWKFPDMHNYIFSKPVSWTTFYIFLSSFVHVRKFHFFLLLNFKYLIPLYLFIKSVWENIKL